jgi:homoserine dehydrogenase
VAGIINGTTNFMLSEMKYKGVDFDAALQDAQNRDYAEQDPSFDVDGIDAAHKLALLASNAFGMPLQFDCIHIEGIRSVEQRDVAFAEHLGFAVKLLGIAERTANGVSLRVQPALIPSDNLLAHVHGTMNAVMVHSDAAGLTMYYGAGVGAEQTASAVIADLVDVSRCMDTAPHHRVPYLAFQESAIAQQAVVAAAEVVASYYLRVDLCSDARGLPELVQLLRMVGVQLVQQELLEPQDSKGDPSVLLLTATGSQQKIHELIAAIEQQAGVDGAVKLMRIERLN